MSKNTTPPVSGKLYLVPSPLNEQHIDILPGPDLTTVKALDMFICEKGKTARVFLKAIGTDKPLQEMEFFELDKHLPKANIKTWIQLIKAGRSAGLISEAGCPGVADPGAAVVAEAHAAGVEVVPLIGPSSLLLSLMASGFNGQQFVFHGYLPVETGERKKSIRQMEAEVKQSKQTQLFIETPYRNISLWKDLMSTLAPYTQLCIAMDITGPDQYIRTHSIKDWQQKPMPALDKKPTVFLIGNTL